MCSGSKDADDAGGRGQSLDPRDGVQGRPVDALLGELGRNEEDMYEVLSDCGGGISGLKDSTEGARESGIDEVDGWYERWIGETLCEWFGEQEYTICDSEGLFFLGKEKRVTLLGFLFASLGVKES